MDFRIESNVPAPAVLPKSKYPFSRMEVGDSFFIPDDKIRDRVYAAANSYGKARGQKYIVRKYGDGYRCWRKK